MSNFSSDSQTKFELAALPTDTYLLTEKAEPLYIKSLVLDLMCHTLRQLTAEIGKDFPSAIDVLNIRSLTAASEIFHTNRLKRHLPISFGLLKEIRTSE